MNRIYQGKDAAHYGLQIPLYAGNPGDLLALHVQRCFGIHRRQRTVSVVQWNIKIVPARSTLTTHPYGFLSTMTSVIPSMCVRRICCCAPLITVLRGGLDDDAEEVFDGELADVDAGLLVLALPS